MPQKFQISRTRCHQLIVADPFTRPQNQRQVDGYHNAGNGHFIYRIPQATATESQERAPTQCDRRMWCVFYFHGTCISDRPSTDYSSHAKSVSPT